MAMTRIRPARIKTSFPRDAKRCSCSCSGCEGIFMGNLQESRWDVFPIVCRFYTHIASGVMAPIAMICRAVPSHCAPASPRDEKQPGRSQHQEHEEAESRGQQAEPVEFSLGQVVAADEDDILAATLRRDGREGAAAEQ